MLHASRPFYRTSYFGFILEIRGMKWERFDFFLEKFTISVTVINLKSDEHNHSQNITNISTTISVNSAKFRINKLRDFSIWATSHFVCQTLTYFLAKQTITTWFDYRLLIGLYIFLHPYCTFCSCYAKYLWHFWQKKIRTSSLFDYRIRRGLIYFSQSHLSYYKIQQHKKSSSSVKENNWSLVSKFGWQKGIAISTPGNVIEKHCTGATSQFIAQSYFSWFTFSV